MKNNLTGFIVGAVLVIAVIIGIVYYENNKTSQTSMNTSGGSLYVGVADASSDMADVNDINMSIDKVEIHSATDGWMTLSSDQKTYALLALNASGQTQLYTKQDNVQPGTYDKVRVTLGDTVVHTKTSGDMNATMPSSQIVINTDLNVHSGQTTNFKMDVIGNESLHKTSDNHYVFAPVVQAESRSDATVAVAGDNTLTATGGTVDSNTNVGMDLDGTSKANFVLSTDNTLKVDSNYGGQINFTLGGKSITSDNSTVQENEVTNANSTNGSTNVNSTGGLQINGSVNTTPGSTSGSAGINTNLTY